MRGGAGALPNLDPALKASPYLEMQPAGSDAWTRLLADARRDVPATLRDLMTERYFAAFPALDRALFRRSGAILAAQRNCKILGIFTRLWRRDERGKLIRTWSRD